MSRDRLQLLFLKKLIIIKDVPSFITSHVTLSAYMVNTFLVHPDYAISAQVLDSQRLGKQRVEAAQIIDAIDSLHKGDPKKGWTNHPATRSWANNVGSLKLYFNAIVSEWVSRGFANNYELYTDIESDTPRPYWVDCPAVHYSHMAQLIQKDPLYYCKSNLKEKVCKEMLAYFRSMPKEYNEYGYIWPYKHTKKDLKTKPLKALAEPFTLRPRCQHPNCRYKASFGDHCGIHRDKTIIIGPCKGFYKNGNACRNKSLYGSTFCKMHTYSFESKLILDNTTDEKTKLFTIMELANFLCDLGPELASHFGLNPKEVDEYLDSVCNCRQDR